MEGGDGNGHNKRMSRNKQRKGTETKLLRNVIKIVSAQEQGLARR